VGENTAYTDLRGEKHSMESAAKVCHAADIWGKCNGPETGVSSLITRVREGKRKDGPGIQLEQFANVPNTERSVNVIQVGAWVKKDETPEDRYKGESAEQEEQVKRRDLLCKDSKGTD